jgi:integrase
MDVLGHSQLSITMDLYSHVMPNALRDAADAMDRALNGTRGSRAVVPTISVVL